MTTKLLAAALVLVALLALVGFTYGPARVPQWEYQIVTLPVTGDDKADAKKVGFDGREGWELVATERGGGRRTYIFKRPL